MAKARNRASDKITREFRAYLDGRGTFNSTLAKGTAGYFDQNQIVDAAGSGVYRGIEIQSNSYPYTKLTINSVQVILDYSGATNVYIIDLLQGRLVDTIPFTAVAGEITTVNIRKTYSSNGQELHYLVALDGDLDSFDTYINPIGSCDRNNSGVIGYFLYVNAVETSKNWCA